MEVGKSDCDDPAREGIEIRKTASQIADSMVKVLVEYKIEIKSLILGNVSVVASRFEDRVVFGMLIS